ncbi:hypothetical protein BDN71DRAFT_1432681 [Pleurotus eryngii]|uniref:Uncharacterized protein n=1 Tax=Pleurotus eryngii TaxID=5323 RepID=A0A9P5ZRM9_PLEER|nr:hypothetical protein BDN71DRAFT_1432681 [Pleurotus eryngii]
MYHPQHYQPSRPYLPLIHRHCHLNFPSKYPEFTSVFEISEVWQPDLLSSSNSRRIRSVYINKLLKCNKVITEDMLSLYNGLRRSGSESRQLLWKCWPVYPTDMNICNLNQVDTFDKAIDMITSMQWRIKYCDAWMQYARMKDQPPIDPTDYVFVMEGNEWFMGIWVSNEYRRGEESYHHRMYSTLPSDLMQNYSLIFTRDAPWRLAERRSNLRTLALGDGDLKTDAPEVPSMQEVQAWPVQDRAALCKQSCSKVSVQDMVRTLGSSSLTHTAEPQAIAGKGKQQAISLLSSFHKSFEEQSCARSSTQLCEEADELKLCTAIRNLLIMEPWDHPPPSSTSVSSVSLEGPSSVASCAISERHAELYGPYSFMLSKFWQVDKLPSEIHSASNFLHLLQSIAKKIPFEVQQMLCTWQDNRVIYWMYFRDSDQAMCAQGYPSHTGVSNSDRCDGLAISKAMYLLALEEVQNPEKCPASPTSFWNILVMLDTRFIKSSLPNSSSSHSAGIAFPSQVYWFGETSTL